MRRLIMMVLLPLILLAAHGQDRGAEGLVRQYLQARSQTMQEGAGSSDIERALAFCAEGFVYEHPSAGARIQGKENVRAGMSGYLGKRRTQHIRYESSRAIPMWWSRESISDFW